MKYGKFQVTYEAMVGTGTLESNPSLVLDFESSLVPVIDAHFKKKQIT